MHVAVIVNTYTYLVPPPLSNIKIYICEVLFPIFILVFTKALNVLSKIISKLASDTNPGP